MIWRLSDKFDPAAVAIRGPSLPAARSQGRRSSFARGDNFALVAITNDAVWATWSGFAHHEWAGAWENTHFRNEGAGLSSELILQAVAATRHAWGEPPSLGIISMVDLARVRYKRDPGRCYRRAGFEPVGHTKTRGHLVLQLVPERFPVPEPALWTPERLAA